MPSPQRHEFTSTVFHRQFSAANKPGLTIAPGDTVQTTTVDAGGTDEKGVARAGAQPRDRALPRRDRGAQGGQPGPQKFPRSMIGSPGTNLNFLIVWIFYYTLNPQEMVALMEIASSEPVQPLQKQSLGRPQFLPQSLCPLPVSSRTTAPLPIAHCLLPIAFFHYTFRYNNREYPSSV